MGLVDSMDIDYHANFLSVGLFEFHVAIDDRVRVGADNREFWGCPACLKPACIVRLSFLDKAS
jgi:hypothetical protein